MQDQTVPQTRLTFDEFDIPDARLDTPATAEQITETILDELTTAGYEPDTITLEFTDGGRAVAIFDGSNDFRTKLGTVTITAPEPEPDYWLTLADAIRQHADRIATLAGTDWKPTYAGLSVSMADPGNKNPIAGDMVDVVAGAFGLTAKTVKSSGGYYERKASGGPLNGLRFNVYGYVPEPADPEKAALAARVAELEAQLAAGGAR
jgi:hypothetical protein